MTKEDEDIHWKSLDSVAARILDNLRAGTRRKPEAETHTEPNSTNNAATPTLTNAHATNNNAMPVVTNMTNLQRGGRARCPAASQGGNEGDNPHPQRELMRESMALKG